MPVYPFTPNLIDQLRAACAAFPCITTPHSDTLHRAAVGIVLLPMDDGSGETGFLLTRRAAKLRAHSAQFALPGGRIDPQESAVETVIRETAEELGLNLSPDDVLGVLDDYPTRSGYVITPVVMATAGDQPIIANPDEVAQVYRISLVDVTRENAAQFIAIPESDRPVIRFPLLGTLIHAPTAAMFYQFAELVHGRTTRVAHLEQPVFAWR